MFEITRDDPKLFIQLVKKRKLTQTEYTISHLKTVLSFTTSQTTDTRIILRSTKKPNWRLKLYV